MQAVTEQHKDGTPEDTGLSSAALQIYDVPPSSEDGSFGTTAQTADSPCSLV